MPVCPVEVGSYGRVLSETANRRTFEQSNRRRQKYGVGIPTLCFGILRLDNRMFGTANHSHFAHGAKKLFRRLSIIVAYLFVQRAVEEGCISVSGKTRTDTGNDNNPGVSPRFPAREMIAWEK
jgi:hypothetical protein